jgi:hypothetical protein
MVQVMPPEVLDSYPFQGRAPSFGIDRVNRLPPKAEHPLRMFANGIGCGLALHA